MISIKILVTTIIIQSKVLNILDNFNHIALTFELSNVYNVKH